MFRRKQSVGLLLILLFAGRTLIPDGYMLASTEENNLSSIKLNLCPSQNNFSFDSDGLDTAESPTHHHHHHHPINSAIGENVEHKNDTTVSSSESCSLWAGSNTLAGAAVLPRSRVDRSTTSVRIKRTTFFFKNVYRDLPQPRAPPLLPI